MDGYALRGEPPSEDELDRRLHLVRLLTRPREAHGLDVGVATDLAGAALAGQLLGRAAQAQLVEDGAGVLDARGGGEAARLERRAAPATRRVTRAS